MHNVIPSNSKHADHAFCRMTGSQDMLLCLRSGLIGFALKAASQASGTGWSALRDEISKAPGLPAHTPYCMVLWSLNLSPQLRDALGGVDAALFENGVWKRLSRCRVTGQSLRHHYCSLAMLELIMMMMMMRWITRCRGPMSCEASCRVTSQGG